jgi:hypothetical protein
MKLLTDSTRSSAQRIGVIALGTFTLTFPSAVGASSHTSPTANTNSPTDAKPSQYFDPSGSLGNNSGLPMTTAVDYVLMILAVLLSLVGLIAIIMILYAGVLILTSAGNEDRIRTGKSILIWSIVGLLIIFSSLGIVLFVNRFIS